MPEIKEELKNGNEAEAPKEEIKEEDTEGLFNPFAEKEEGDEKEEVEKPEPKEEEEVEKEEEALPVTDSIAEEYQADKQASKEVREYVKENPMFEEYSDELKEIASKAIQSGHNRPVEFAIRNLKSPKDWIELGKKSGVEDAGNVLRSTVGGASVGKKNETPADYGKMSSKEFEKTVMSIKNA